MKTSRALTSRRRDIVAQLVDDNPDTADLLLELMIATDSATAAGAAARLDVLRHLYSLTPHCTAGLQRRIRELTASAAALVACALYVVG